MLNETTVTPETLIKEKDSTLQLLLNLKQIAKEKNYQTIKNDGEYLYIVYSSSCGYQLDGSLAPEEVRLYRNSTPDHDNFYIANYGAKEHFLIQFDKNEVLKVEEIDIPSMQAAGVWGGYHTQFMETKYDVKGGVDRIIGAFDTQRRLNKYSAFLN